MEGSSRGRNPANNKQTNVELTFENILSILTFKSQQKHCRHKNMKSIILLLFSLKLIRAELLLQNCGIPNYEFTLNGCQDAKRHQFPWHARITASGFTCGGSVICKSLFLD